MSTDVWITGPFQNDPQNKEIFRAMGIADSPSSDFKGPIVKWEHASQ